MLTEKLDANDLNLEARRNKFDGTFAYGQNKVNDSSPFSYFIYFP